MKEQLISLGAEVLSTTPEMVTSETQHFILVAGFLFLCVLCVVLFFHKRVPNNLVMCLPVLLAADLLFVLMGTVFAPPQKSSGKTIFEILINDQTNMQGIFEQFEVVDTSNYPILTVKSK